MLVGATPVFADVEEATFNLDPDSLRGRAPPRESGGFDQRPSYRSICSASLRISADRGDCRGENLFVLDDAAQAFGATYRNRGSGRSAPATATSFFPANLSAVMAMAERSSPTTRNLAHVMRSLRMHGEGRDKYDCVRIGINGRLDTIQAAVLIEKLKIFPEEIVRARAHRAALHRGHCATSSPFRRCAQGSTSVWAQYTIRLPAGRRDGVAAALRAQGIPTAIYYPMPLHLQEPYQRFQIAEGGAPVSERLAGEVISLPMHAYLDEATQDRIIAAARARAGRLRADLADKCGGFDVPISIAASRS